MSRVQGGMPQGSPRQREGERTRSPQGREGNSAGRISSFCKGGRFSVKGGLVFLSLSRLCYIYTRLPMTGTEGSSIFYSYMTPAQEIPEGSRIFSGSSTPSMAFHSLLSL